MEPLEAKISLGDFGQVFNDSLTGALAHASDLGWTASIATEPAAALEHGQHDTCFLFRFTGALAGEAHLFAAKSAIQELECRVADGPDAVGDASETG